MKKEIIVGISDYKIACKPDKLITYALGSCIGTIIIDYQSKIAGLSHILLYDSTLFKTVEDRKKYADTAIPDMVKELIKCGANKHRLRAYIAGGARTFLKGNAKSHFEIGSSNIKAVKEILKTLSIPIVKEDVGGNLGRTLAIDLETEEVLIKYAKQLKDIKIDYI